MLIITVSVINFLRDYDVAVQAFLASKELEVANSRNLSRFYSYANSKLKNIYLW